MIWGESRAYRSTSTVFAWIIKVDFAQARRGRRVNDTVRVGLKIVDDAIFLRLGRQQNLSAVFRIDRITCRFAQLLSELPP